MGIVTRTESVESTVKRFAVYLLACQNRDIDEGSAASSAQGKVMYRKKSDGYFAEYNLSLPF